jgi:hypothetical protein
MPKTARTVKGRTVPVEGEIETKIIYSTLTFNILMNLPRRLRRRNFHGIVASLGGKTRLMQIMEYE